jgi:nucleotide-binding universal stress UspA family protein
MFVMKTIIAPTDFSPVSLNAVQYAADMATATDTDLLLLHASETPFGTTAEYNEEETEQKLVALKNHLLERTGHNLRIGCKQVVGMIENELMKMCDAKDPFAVVMATHGDSLRKLFFVGSITVYLSRNLKYPVIVVPENAVFKQVNKIALATDMKDVYDLPVEKISGVVKALGAELNIVHVNNGNRHFSEHSIEVKLISSLLKELGPEFHFINNEKNVQNGILSFVNNNNIDMILLLPKKNSLFHKSASKQFIFNSPVTVMTIQ